MAFVYTSGDPSNVTSAETASMDDIKGPLEDIQDYFDGNVPVGNISSVGNASLTSPNNGTWKTIYDCYGTYGLNQLGATPQQMNTSTHSGIPVGTAGGGVNCVWLCPTFSDIQAAGLTTYIRVRTVYITNSIAAGVTANISLYPVTGTAGAASSVGISSVGSPLATAAIPSAATTAGQAVSAAVALSSLTAGTTYLVGATSASGTGAANSAICCCHFVEMSQS